jgi:hypothetical protein
MYYRERREVILYMKATFSAYVNLVIAAALLITPFFVGFTSSAPYDPWADLDSDGDIDIFDVVKMVDSYGTTGDPAKNVTIAGRISKMALTVTNQIVDAGGSYQTPWIIVDGYSKVTICLYTGATNNYYRLSTTGFTGGVPFKVDEQSDFGMYLVKTYDVPNQKMIVYFGNDEATARTLWIQVYLVA